MSVGMSAEQKARVTRWTKALRETELGQTSGQLFNTNLGTITDACCLGICLVEFKGESYVRDNDLLGANMSAVVPEVLGLPDLGAVEGDTGDVFLDWPREMWPRQGEPNTNPPSEWPSIAASWLNDFAHCTFGQIADLVDYFGLVVHVKEEE